MSDQINPAPAQVSQPHAPPTTATAQPTNNSPPAPAAAAPLATTFAAPAPQNATPAEEPQTLNDKLNAVDRYWKFKLAFQVALVITGVIGIGTIAWTISNRASVEFFDYDGYYYQWPGLVPFVVSVLWCLICILVLVLHKKPVHPGARVALDLLLWLGFIFSVMFAMIGLLNLESWAKMEVWDTGIAALEDTNLRLMARGSGIVLIALRRRMGNSRAIVMARFICQAMVIPALSSAVAASWMLTSTRPGRRSHIASVSCSRPWCASSSG